MGSVAGRLGGEELLDDRGIFAAGRALEVAVLDERDRSSGQTFDMVGRSRDCRGRTGSWQAAGIAGRLIHGQRPSPRRSKAKTITKISQKMARFVFMEMSI